MKKVCTSIVGYCEEFTSHIYEDKKHNSILINIPHEWFSVFNKGMEHRHYKLVHLTEMPKTLTAVYIKS